MRLSARASEQIFLSGDPAVHGEWSVAGRDDGAAHSSSTITHSLSAYENL